MSQETGSSSVIPHAIRNVACTASLRVMFLCSGQALALKAHVENDERNTPPQFASQLKTPATALFRLWFGVPHPIRSYRAACPYELFAGVTFQSTALPRSRTC